MTDWYSTLARIEDPEVIKQVISLGQQTSIGQVTQEKRIEEYYYQYLERRQNRSPSTRAQYKRTLPRFIEFAVDYGADYPREISTQLVNMYTDNLFGSYTRDATIWTYIKNLRAWLSWLAKRTDCDNELAELLNKDEVGLSPNARDEAISVKEAKHRRERLRERRYGSAQHAMFETLWNSGIRIGGAYSLDRCDVNCKENEIELRNRPDAGTRLKNGDSSDDTSGDGERIVSIEPEVSEVLKTYISAFRKDVTDDYDREPLFTTAYGRAARSTLRRWTYKATDCRWTATEAAKLDCDGTCDADSNVCPESYYPHAIRRGAIVAHLVGGLSPKLASERFDVSYRVIKEHYDPRTKQQQKRNRKNEVKQAWDNI